MEIQPEEQMEQPDNSKFSINTWFNNLPIRIIGTPDEPFFYASDIAAILGIKQVSASIKNFGCTEIASPEMRTRHNLITYRKYKGSMKSDDRIILLTEFGAYRLIINSRSDMAQEFKIYIYEIIRDARRKETEKLNVIDPETLQAMNTRLAELESFVKDIQHNNPVIYVFKTIVNGNPHKCVLPEDRDNCIANVSNEKCKKLYKFTTKPNPRDYTAYNLTAKIYGISDNIMDELYSESIDINPKSLSYCRYLMDYDLDDISECVISRV